MLPSPPQSAPGLPYSGGFLSLGILGEPWKDAFEALALRSAYHEGGACGPGGPFAVIGLSYKGARRLEAATGNRV